MAGVSQNCLLTVLIARHQLNIPDRLRIDRKWSIIGSIRSSIEQGSDAADSVAWVMLTYNRIY